MIFFELLLSADNATALGLIVKGLPKELRQKALLVGFLSSLFLRALAILGVSYLIGAFWLQIVGGLYLVVLGVNHLLRKGTPILATQKTSFIKKVLLIEWMDFVFAIDSILAAFALVGIYYPIDKLESKLWVIYLGGIIGALAVRFAASYVASLLERFPSFETIAHLLVALMGAKLITDGILLSIGISESLYADIAFWVLVPLLIIIGFLYKKR